MLEETSGTGLERKPWRAFISEDRGVCRVKRFAVLERIYKLVSIVRGNYCFSAWLYKVKIGEYFWTVVAVDESVACLVIRRDSNGSILGFIQRQCPFAGIAVVVAIYYFQTDFKARYVYMGRMASNSIGV